MIINIFGCGRSGTKAAQLYLSYMFALREQKVRLNYEPYFWLTRKGIPSFEGICFDNQTPIFTNNVNHFSNKHNKFLSRLVDNNFPTVTKFIRANGRIKALNRIMNPDLNLLIIRDLYEVLASLSELDWNFYSKGYKFYNLTYYDKWNEIINQLKNYNDFDWNGFKELKENKLLKNAIYWYATNRYSLENLPENSFVINYENLSRLETIVKDNFRIYSNLKVASFNGSDINTNYPLVSNQRKKTCGLQRKIIYNQVKYSISKTKYRYLLPYNMFSLNHGDLVSIVTSAKHIKLRETKTKLKYHLPRNPFFDYLNLDIKKRINAFNISTYSLNE